MSQIEFISCALPEREVSNAELERENPSWEMARVVKRSGVHRRRVAAPGETAFDLSVRACEALVAERQRDLGDVDALLYCTQTPDFRLPGNAGLLHRRLGLPDEVLGFDYCLACSGYVYGLAFADSFLRGGLASRVLLVTADTYSKIVDPADRSARAVFGDGAAVTLLGDGEDNGGIGAKIVASDLCTRGEGLERFQIPAGGARRPGGRGQAGNRANGGQNPESIHMDGPAVWAFANSAVPSHVERFLAEQSLALADVDLFVFHQASRMALESLTRALGLDPEKVYMNIADVGNLVSASIPFALRSALDAGTIRAGNRILLTGFGAGLSYGSVLLEL